MKYQRPKCEDRYVSGYRQGEPCPFQSSEVIVPQLGRPRRVCGYHARAYIPSARYPLWANLAMIRRLQWRAIRESIDRA